MVGNGDRRYLAAGDNSKPEESCALSSIIAQGSCRLNAQYLQIACSLLSW
jgi:hypothetical protein